MREKIRNALKRIPPNVRLFAAVLVFSSFCQGIYDATFNNYIHGLFSLSGADRSAIELPREFPGFSVAFVSALLFFLSGTRLAALAMFLQAAGIALLGFFSHGYSTMLAWLFVFSLGQHLFLPLFSSIGMDLAHKGAEGKRLGQFNSIKNLAMILGSAFIFFGFRFFNLSFMSSYATASVMYVIAGVFMLFLREPKSVHRHSLKTRLTLRKEYGLFYWLNILYGTRKQIFITFGPWVLVSVYGMPTQYIATLLTVGGIIGIVFQPLLGKAVDRIGEKKVLALEAAILIPVCAGYGFSRLILPETPALVVTSVCYVIDMLLMSFGIARATYLKKIAIDPSHVSPALTLATTIDHVFSISIALVSGFVWMWLGYPAVFGIGAGIAVITLFSTMFVKVPSTTRQRPLQGVRLP